MQYWLIPDFPAWLLSLLRPVGGVWCPQKATEGDQAFEVQNKESVTIKHGWDGKEAIKECKPQIPIIVCYQPIAHTNLHEHAVR